MAGKLSIGHAFHRWSDHLQIYVAIDAIRITFNISFVPIRPGEYSIYVSGYENRGLKGTFVVK